MDIIEINPQLCKRWQFADRSNFEFGDKRLDRYYKVSI